VARSTVARLGEGDRADSDQQNKAEPSAADRCAVQAPALEFGPRRRGLRLQATAEHQGEKIGCALVTHDTGQVGGNPWMISSMVVAWNSPAWALHIRLHRLRFVRVTQALTWGG